MNGKKIEAKSHPKKSFHIKWNEREKEAILFDFLGYGQF